MTVIEEKWVKAPYLLEVYWELEGTSAVRHLLATSLSVQFVCQIQLEKKHK